MKTMNKTIICAAAAIALAGCAKEMEMPADQELRKMSFTGVVDDNIGTKTALTSDYNVIWTSGDQISVFANGNNSQFTASNIRASESGLEDGVATFEGMATAADVYYGVYPYNESATISETIVSTVLPTDQTAVAGSFAVGSNISVAKAAEEDVLQFRNAGAIVGLTVNGEGISAIRLQSADGTAAMSGAVTVDVSGDTPVMALASGAVNHVRLVAEQPSDDNPDATGTLTSGSTYYFVVAPGEYSGLQLVFENAGLDATYTTSTAEVVTVERNGNKNLGSFTVGEEDWIVNTYADYELNGKAKVDEFIATVPEGEKLELRNLTVTGHDVTTEVLGNLAQKVSAVRGTLILDGIGTENTGEWFDTNVFFSHVDCQGDIIFRNMQNIVNPNGFTAYTSIGGDFIIENCPNFVLNWTTDLINITEIAGDLILSNVKNVCGPTFSGLRKVGGNVQLSEIANLRSLADRDVDDKGYPVMQLEQIGGDLIIQDNPNLNSLDGFESLIHIGGNVIISGNSEDLPEASGPVGEHDCIGLCLIKDLLNMGVISADATITLTTGEDDHTVDIETLQSCNPDRTSQSYVINGEAALIAFVDGAGDEKETVYDLTITGTDFTEGTLRNIEERVAAIEGTLTFTDLNTAGGVWFSTDQCLENIDLKGSIVFRNIACPINPNGMKMWTTIPGDIIIENCPEFPTGEGWRPFESVTEVGGDVIVTGPVKRFGADFLANVKKIGGDFHIEGINESFWEYKSETLTEIGGDLVIKDCAVFCNGGAAFYGFSHLTRLGGDVIIDIPTYSLPKNDYSPSLVGICIFNYYKQNGIMSPDATISIIDGSSNGEPIDMSTVGSCGGPFPEQ